MTDRHERDLARARSKGELLRAAMLLYTETRAEALHACMDLLQHWAPQRLPDAAPDDVIAALARRGAIALSALGQGEITRDEYDTERAAVLAEWERYATVGGDDG